MVVHLTLFHYLFNWKIEQYFPSLLGLSSTALEASNVEASDSHVDVVIRDDSWQHSDYHRVSESAQSDDEWRRVNRADEASPGVAESHSLDTPSAATTTLPVKGERRTHQIIAKVIVMYRAATSA